MSLHFLIDGYNVIKRIDSLKVIHPLEKARVSLVKVIQAKRFMSSGDNQVTIVFDGKNNLDLCLNQNKDRIKIIFSRGESADETIKRIAEGSGKPKQIIVVTDDKAIVFFVRSLGVKTMSVSEFIGEERRQFTSMGLRKRAQEARDSLKKELSYEQQEAINQELKRVWGERKRFP